MLSFFYPFAIRVLYFFYPFAILLRSHPFSIVLFLFFAYPFLILLRSHPFPILFKFLALVSKSSGYVNATLQVRRFEVDVVRVRVEVRGQF